MKGYKPIPNRSLPAPEAQMQIKRNGEVHAVTNISRTGDQVNATIGCEQVSVPMDTLNALSSAKENTERGFYAVSRTPKNGSLTAVHYGPAPSLSVKQEGGDFRIYGDGTNHYLALNGDYNRAAREPGATAVFAWEWHNTKPTR